MMNQTFSFGCIRVLMFGLVVGGSPGEVMAALGQAPSVPPSSSSSAQASGARLLAATPHIQSSLYAVHEVQLENGTIVQEYSTQAGIVFAVGWRGPVLPDMRVLLGNYFNTFKIETDQARMMGKRGSPLSIQRDDLVVRSSGRMRNFFGHAYAPALIPSGVNIKDVLQ